MKTLNSPNESVSKEQLLTLQEATTKIKQIIASDVLGGVPKSVTEGKIKAILKQYRENSKLSPTQTKTLEDSLIRFAQAQHYTLTNNMKVINARAISSMAIDPSVLVGGKVPTSMITEDKFRGYVTNGAKGLPTIKDYQKQVRNQLKVLASQPPKVVSYTNKNGTKVSYTMSARNRAEMAVRYEANMEDLAKFKEDGTNLVWTSSHADCSKRCQKWQGKLFSLNGTKGSIDGIPYEPIENALNDNGGNSIINGYNCRHYLIEYQKGMKAPANYNSAEIKKQRAIDTKQRYYENQIRKEKQEEAVLRAAGMTKEADKLNSRWHTLNERYEAFSKQNNRAFYTWRTQVMRDERFNSGILNPIPPQQTPIIESPTPTNNTVNQKEVISSKIKVVNSYNRIPSQQMEIQKELIANLSSDIPVLKNYLENCNMVLGDTKNSDCEAAASPGALMGFSKPQMVLNVNTYEDPKKREETQRNQSNSNWAMPCAEDKLQDYTTTHETGHLLSFAIIYKKINNEDKQKYEDMRNRTLNNTNMSRSKTILKNFEMGYMKSFCQEIFDIARENNPNFNVAENISTYGKTNYAECFAEMFANAKCGKPNELGNAMNIWLERLKDDSR